MAQEPDRLAFRVGVVLAVAVIVLAIMTWAGPQILRALRLGRSHRGK